MKVKQIFQLLLIAFTLTLAAQQMESIQARMDELVKENGLPGLNFSIIYADGTQENYSAGLADKENDLKMTTNKVMFSGSIGKTFAVALLLQLVDEGKVDLDRKYVEYFPELEWINNLPNINEFTTLMLLQHSSGLPRYVHHKEVWETTRNEPDKVWSYEDRLKFIFEDEAVNEPGKEWNYSDTGYLLIGMLVEKFYGDYYKKVSDRILKSNNLTETYGSLTRDIPNLAVGYSDLPEFLTPKITVVDERYYFNPQMEWTGGGMASTTSDLARWADLYYSGKLFSDSLQHKMITPTFDLGNGMVYGAGSFIYETKLGKAYGHTGLMPGYKSIFIYFPEKEIACALQMNCDYGVKKLSLVGYVERILDVIKS